MIRVFLMGFMGAGKTTLGKALAIDMGIDFHDLDQYIERRYMMSISSIFAKQGERSSVGLRAAFCVKSANWRML
jgi:shikimate kinase